VQCVYRMLLPLCTFMTEGGYPWGYTLGYSRVEINVETSAHCPLPRMFPDDE